MKLVLIILGLSLHIYAGILPTIQGYDERTGKPVWGTTEDSGAYSGKSTRMRSDEGQILPPEVQFDEKEYQTYVGTGLERLIVTISDASSRLTYGRDNSKKSLLPQTFIIKVGENKIVEFYFQNPKDSESNHNLPVKIAIAYTTQKGTVSPTIIIEPNAHKPIFVPVSVKSATLPTSVSFSSNSENSSDISGIINFKGMN